MLRPRSNAAPHVVFAGGATGGHLFPGLAVAQQLKLMAPAARITFAGTDKPLERRQVRAAGHEHLAIECHPLPRGALQALGFLAANYTGFRTAAAFLDRHEVAAVIGLGGYASMPMARAAASRGIPLILLEQNAVAGRATRWLAAHASLICAAFEQVRPQLRLAGPLRVTGNPIRGLGAKGFDVAHDEQFANGDEMLLLILGGSQGARSINQAAPRALHALRSQLAGWKVVHQAGEADLAATRAMYRGLGIAATVSPFIQHLPRVLRHAQLVVSRAGGTTLAELAAAGLPAVLAPYPHASDDHQLLNARAYESQGACRVVDERSREGHLHERIGHSLGDLLVDGSLRATMSAAMRRQAHIEAAWHVARMTLGLASCQRHRAA